MARPGWLYRSAETSRREAWETRGKEGCIGRESSKGGTSDLPVRFLRRDLIKIQKFRLLQDPAAKGIRQPLRPSHSKQLPVVRQNPRERKRTRSSSSLSGARTERARIPFADHITCRIRMRRFFGSDSMSRPVTTPIRIPVFIKFAVWKDVPKCMPCRKVVEEKDVSAPMLDALRRLAALVAGGGLERSDVAGTWCWRSARSRCWGEVYCAHVVSPQVGHRSTDDRTLRRARRAPSRLPETSHVSGAMCTALPITAWVRTGRYRRMCLLRSSGTSPTWPSRREGAGSWRARRSAPVPYTKRQYRGPNVIPRNPHISRRSSASLSLCRSSCTAGPSSSRRRIRRTGCACARSCASLLSPCTFCRRRMVCPSSSWRASARDLRAGAVPSSVSGGSSVGVCGLYARRDCCSRRGVGSFWPPEARRRCRREGGVCVRASVRARRGEPRVLAWYAGQITAVAAACLFEFVPRGVARNGFGFSNKAWGVRARGFCAAAARDLGRLSPESALL